MSNDKSTAYAAAELATELREDPSEPIRSYAGLIDDDRVIDLLNYYDSLSDEPIEDTPLGREIIKNAATHTIDDAVRHGSVSQMKTGTGLTSNERDGGELFGDVTELLRHEGAIGLTFGSPGSGKTAVTIDAATSWQARTGGSLIGNTEWDGFEQVVTSDQEMLEAMGSIKGPVLAVLDEIAQDLSGFGEGNVAAEQFSDSLLMVRKREEQHGEYAKRGSVLLTAHTRTKTAAEIRRVASFAIEKPYQNDPGIARLLMSEGGKDVWDEKATYQGITDSAADYDEHEPSEFKVVLEDDDGDDGFEVDDVKKQEHIKTAIKAADRGMSYADIGKQHADDDDHLVPYSREWVGNRYREWRDNDLHTELVPKDD